MFQGTAKIAISRLTSISARLLTTGAVAFLFLHSAAADPEQDARLMSRPLLTQNGQLFVIQFTPKARRVDVLTAGKSVATLDPSSIKIFGRVYPIDGSPRDLKIEWKSGHFQIAEPIEANVPIELEVSDKATAKSETFRFDKSSPQQNQKTPKGSDTPTQSIPVSPR